MMELKNRYTIFFFILFYTLTIEAQYLPKDDAKLNYNQIYFEYPYHKNATVYKLYLAFDTVSDKKDFKTSLYNIYTDQSPALKVDGLAFGKKYKWYIETNLTSGEKLLSDIHYFSTLNTPYTDTSKYKVKINYNKSTKIQDGLIWCDHLHCALNRKGELVWFIAPLNKDFKEDRQIRYFRFQKDGSITFISEPEAFHTDRDLNIIWKAPNNGKINGDTQEFYHHNFKKLKNGNYMALGNHYLELERSDTKDTASRKVELATLIEYSPKGDIVWSWRMIDHFPLDLLASEKGNSVLNPHCNAFSIDKNNQFIYLGFRDISRIIKVEKATGNIVAAFGQKLNKTDTTVIETGIFSHPHDATILDDNSLMVLNNNEVAKGKISSVEIFTQPNAKNKKVTSLWSFKFNFDTLTNGKSLKLGGYKRLDNGNLLINEGVINRIVEVSKNKEVLWDLMIFKKDAIGYSWSSFPQYNIDFSTSLYPYYFSVGIQELSEKKVSIVLFNEGDHNDSYIYELYNTDGMMVTTRKSGIVTPKAKSQANFSDLKPGKYTLRVISVESGLKKTIELK